MLQPSRGVGMPISATKSAQNGSADTVAGCPLLRDERI
jgi:hypothetical protein